MAIERLWRESTRAVEIVAEIQRIKETFEADSSTTPHSPDVTLDHEERATSL